MREQIAYRKIPQRTSAPAASRAYTGHSAGIHPEEDEEEYPQETRPGTSAIRYTDTRGNQVIRQGNRQIVIHRELPPKQRRFHWMLFVGLALFIMVLGWVAVGALANWWQDKQNDPVTISFEDVNGDGKPDMLVHVAGFTIALLNTGKTFQGKHP